MDWLRSGFTHALDGSTGLATFKIYPPRPTGTPILSFFILGEPQNKTAAPWRGSCPIVLR
jgi:hypothetical protein